MGDKVGENPAALRAAVFLLSAKNRRGGVFKHPPPSRAKVNQPSAYTRHMKSHNGVKAYRCQVCPSRFVTRWDLTLHTRTHTGERPYGCSFCPDRFVKRSDLTVRTRTHTGERPYGCSFCPDRFTRQSHVNEHVSALHTHDYRHRCGQCGKGFVRPGDLRRLQDKCSGNK